MYIRKICYLDYLENNVRIGNAGHVKFCLHDKRLVLEVRIRGLSRAMDGQTDVRLLGTEAENAGTALTQGQADTMPAEKMSMLGMIGIRGGSGSFRGEFDAEDMDGKGNGFLKFRGIEILLPGGAVLHTDFEYEEVNAAAKDENKKEKGKEEKGKKERIEKKEQKEQVPGSKEDRVARLQCAEHRTPEHREIGREMPEADSETEQEKWMPDMPDERLSVDKWEQLCRNYRQLHPFGDKTYISLTPRDFVILRKEYQQLVNNSFLLHGFYNYRHLILGKEAVKEGDIYYLGVPGTYYDREKMVAVMFGFEGFEASGTAQNQTEDTEGVTAPGTFGYYMKRVEI